MGKNPYEQKCFREGKYATYGYLGKKEGLKSERLNSSLLQREGENAVLKEGNVAPRHRDIQQGQCH